jgi:hypothetical protein
LKNKVTLTPAVMSVKVAEDLDVFSTCKELALLFVQSASKNKSVSGKVEAKQS